MGAPLLPAAFRSPEKLLLWLCRWW